MVFLAYKPELMRSSGLLHKYRHAGPAFSPFHTYIPGHRRWLPLFNPSPGKEGPSLPSFAVSFSYSFTWLSWKSLLRDIYYTQSEKVANEQYSQYSLFLFSFFFLSFLSENCAAWISDYDRRVSLVYRWSISSSITDRASPGVARRVSLTWSQVWLSSSSVHRLNPRAQRARSKCLRVSTTMTNCSFHLLQASMSLHVQLLRECVQ